MKEQTSTTPILVKYELHWQNGAVASVKCKRAWCMLFTLSRNKCLLCLGWHHSMLMPSLTFLARGIMIELQSGAMQRFQARQARTSRARLARARGKPTRQMVPALLPPPL